MNYRCFLFSIFIISTMLFGCRKLDYSSELSKLIERELGSSLCSYEMIILIPGTGCTGCITNAESYFSNNINNKKLLFILTNNYSEKGLALRLGKDNISKSNVIIDREDIYYLKDYEEKIYPIIVKISDGKIIQMQQL